MAAALARLDNFARILGAGLTDSMPGSSGWSPECFLREALPLMFVGFVDVVARGEVK